MLLLLRWWLFIFINLSGFHVDWARGALHWCVQDQFSQVRGTASASQGVTVTMPTANAEFFFLFSHLTTRTAPFHKGAVWLSLLPREQHPKCESSWRAEIPFALLLPNDALSCLLPRPCSLLPWQRRHASLRIGGGRCNWASVTTGTGCVYRGGRGYSIVCQVSGSLAAIVIVHHAPIKQILNAPWNVQLIGGTAYIKKECAMMLSGISSSN